MEQFISTIFYWVKKVLYFLFGSEGIKSLIAIFYFFTDRQKYEQIINQIPAVALSDDIGTALVLEVILIAIEAAIYIWLVKKIRYAFMWLRRNARRMPVFNLKPGVVLCLVPRRKITITSQKDAIRVLKTLKNYNRSLKKFILCHEISMTLLLDENNELLLACIDNHGDCWEVNSMAHEVVYSYNTSFNGKCKKVIVAHTHPARVDKNMVYIESTTFPSKNDYNSYEFIKRAIHPVKVLDDLVLPALDHERVFSIATNKLLPKKRFRRLPNMYFREVFNTFKEDKALHPTMIGIRLLYREKKYTPKKEEVFAR
ncbi:hypothetical protein Calhy_0313 [Caldicellulosiruptor hydrothermalis 108]|uniref:Uncharacterized protein n=1 Tax=Caldicellulosiruptor hydrothermalis (strain DSM 18901 / VKM B-2411 / 108) TaxID=632292 RepID=E4QBF9_CALH1|nr:JAB domain-containing protein [Caldicellulosiruptor hydrothermalis]ADQ06061.1 hypothetical protein Calhy_0313 [Caldicellulosiruptor hydrothermalis 108]